MYLSWGFLETTFLPLRGKGNVCVHSSVSKTPLVDYTGYVIISCFLLALLELIKTIFGFCFSCNFLSLDGMLVCIDNLIHHTDVFKCKDAQV